MTVLSIDETALASACGALDPAEGLEALIACINGAVDGLTFRHVLTERDWYRVGGIVDAEGSRVAEDLAAWVEAESGGDVIDLIAKHGESGLLATAHKGQTHYLAAPTGDGPMDVVQIEVEETQEVVDRELLRADWIPDTLEDVIDPMDAPSVYPRPITRPHYLFRRVTPLFERAGELTAEYTGDHRFARFLEEWEHSSAGNAARFCEHWVVTVIPYLDNRGDHVQEVKLKSPDAPMVARIDIRHLDEDGERLADLIHGIDRDADYPMAWYFLMLAANYLPYRMVRAIYDKVLTAGRYGHLRERDMKILEQWLEDPYHL